jgi:subtilisin family serine protease
MRLPFRSRPNNKDRQRTLDRRSSERCSFERRFAQSLETLEPRWVLAAPSWENLHDLAEQAGREYASDRISLGFATPTDLHTSEEARQFLANAARETPFAPLAGSFELAYSYTRADATSLTVGDVFLPEGVTVRQALDSLRGTSFVEWAQPDYFVQLTPELIPNDRLYEDEFRAPMNLQRAWDTTTGDPSVLIAIIDTGVHWQHRDFYSEPPAAFPPPANIASNIYFNTREVRDNNLDDDGNGKVDDYVGWDFVDNDNDPTPVQEIDLLPDHGTATAGVIAARINNNVGLDGKADGNAGVAGTSRVLPLRVSTGMKGEVLSSRIRDALAYAVKINEDDPGVRQLIINISLDTDELAKGDEAYVSAIAMAYEKGALIVQSAGNGGPDEIGDANPKRAILGQQLVVAAVGRSEGGVRLQGFSNYGEGVDLVALGAVSYPLAWNPELPGPDFEDGRTGTSIAAANVSGVAALVWSQDLNRTRDQVVARLLGTATNVDASPGNERFAGGLGHGLVNAAAALDANVAVPAPEVTSARFVNNGSQGSYVTTTFSQALDPATARMATNYEIRNTGSNGQFDDLPITDDQVFVVGSASANYALFHYSTGTNELRLDIGGNLPAGEYRLRVNASGANGLRSPFGTPLAGSPDEFFTVGAAEGRTGDVIEVDLKQILGGSNFSELTFPDYTQVVDPLTDIHLQKSSIGFAKLVMPTRVDGTVFTQTGRFFLVPNTVANLEDSNSNLPGFQGAIAGRVKIDNEIRDFQVIVTKGYSTEGPHAVVAGTSVLERMRAQQRLKHFGYHSLNEPELFVDGDWGPHSKEAARLFNAALNNTAKDPADPDIAPDSVES